MVASLSTMLAADNDNYRRCSARLLPESFTWIAVRAVARLVRKGFAACRPSTQNHHCSRLCQENPLTAVTHVCLVLPSRGVCVVRFERFAA